MTVINALPSEEALRFTAQEPNGSLYQFHLNPWFLTTWLLGEDPRGTYSGPLRAFTPEWFARVNERFRDDVRLSETVRVGLEAGAAAPREFPRSFYDAIALLSVRRALPGTTASLSALQDRLPRWGRNIPTVQAEGLAYDAEPFELSGPRQTVGALIDSVSKEPSREIVRTEQEPTPPVVAPPPPRLLPPQDDKSALGDHARNLSVFAAMPTWGWVVLGVAGVVTVGAVGYGVYASSKKA